MHVGILQIHIAEELIGSIIYNQIFIFENYANLALFLKLDH